MVNPGFFDGDLWGFPGAFVEHIETHAAHVFLCGDRAFKIKKDIKLPYLDFSSVELRRAILERELEVNRRFAPDLYIGLIEKQGEPVLVMKRFDAKSMLSWHVDHGGIDNLLAAGLAKTVAQAHGLALKAGQSGAAIMAGLGAQLSKAFAASPDLFPPPLTHEFNALCDDALRHLKPLLNQRSDAGLVQRCHGDLHCANIVILEGKPVLFDAIEFSEKIATIDVLYDLAFLIMDLLRHNQASAANIILNQYLSVRRNEEDLSGLKAFPLFLATRSGVRALVTADLIHELPASESTKHKTAAYEYFKACIDFLKPEMPQLVCVGGLSGTGKSTLAARLAPSLGPPPGAIHIRSDVERKVLAGVAETERLAPELYSSASSVKTYNALFDRAERALAAGRAVIIDAVFARESERHAAEKLATHMGVGFRGIWLDSNPETLKARVALRVGDASDATPDVIDTQLGYDLGNMAWTRVNAGGNPEEVHARSVQLQ